MLQLRDATDPTTAIDTTPSPAVTSIKVEGLQLWHFVLAGIATGFAIALGTAVFNEGARRVGWKI